MPRKVNPRHGKIIPDDPLRIEISVADAERLCNIIDVTDPQKINLCNTEIQFISNLYIARRGQEEEGIRRAERNKALKQLLHCENFKGQLKTLNYEAESALLDAIHLHPDKSWIGDFQVTNAFELIELVKVSKNSSVQDNAVEFMRDALNRCIQDLIDKSGPDKRENIGLALDEIMILYHQLTDKIPTHSVLKGALEQEHPQSPAGKFAKAIFDLINVVLEENGQLKIFPFTLKNQVRAAVKRFNNESPRVKKLK